MINLNQNRGSFSIRTVGQLNRIRHLIAHTDKYSFARIESNRYSTAPNFVSTDVMVMLTADEVKIMTRSHHIIALHRREYGKMIHPIQNWSNYIEAITRKPGAIKYSSFFRGLPNEWQKYFASAAPREAQTVLKSFKRKFEDGTISDVTNALLAAAKHEDHTAEDIEVYYRKLNDRSEILRNVVPSHILIQTEYVTDLGIYGSFMKGV